MSDVDSTKLILQEHFGLAGWERLEQSGATAAMNRITFEYAETVYDSDSDSDNDSDSDDYNSFSFRTKLIPPPLTVDQIIALQNALTADSIRDCSDDAQDVQQERNHFDVASFGEKLRMLSKIMKCFHDKKMSCPELVNRFRQLNMNRETELTHNVPDGKASASCTVSDPYENGDHVFNFCLRIMKINGGVYITSDELVEVLPLVSMAHMERVLSLLARSVYVVDHWDYLVNIFLMTVPNRVSKIWFTFEQLEYFLRLFRMKDKSMNIVMNILQRISSFGHWWRTWGIDNAWNVEESELDVMQDCNRMFMRAFFELIESRVSSLSIEHASESVVERDRLIFHSLYNYVEESCPGIQNWSIRIPMDGLSGILQFIYVLVWPRLDSDHMYRRNIEEYYKFAKFEDSVFEDSVIFKYPLHNVSPERVAEFIEFLTQKLAFGETNHNICVPESSFFKIMQYVGIIELIEVILR